MSACNINASSAVKRSSIKSSLEMKSESMDQINVSVASVHIFLISFGSIIFGSYELFQKTIQFCSFEFLLLFQIVDHLNFLTSLFFWPFFLIFDLLSFWPLNITIFWLTYFFHLFTFWPLNIMIFWPFCLFQFDLYICPQRGQIEIDKKVKKS